ncbi:MAG TPA: Ig-like domain-containing protein, partial [Pirellulaceae bacterium]
GNTFTYTPDFNFVGADSFTYSIGDEYGSSIATVTIDVTSDGGQAPIANTDDYAAAINTTLTAFPSVLANDTDAEGDTLTASCLIEPHYGTLSLDPDGHFTYAPDTGFTGWDSFTYQASDGYLADPMTASIYVDDPPVATDKSYTVTKNVALNVAQSSLFANDSVADGHTLTARLASHPLHGTVNIAANGGFIYTPNPGYTGDDVFTYAASDGYLEDYGDVYLSVIPLDTSLIARNHDYNLTAGEPIHNATTVLQGAVYPAGATPTAILVTPPSHGIVYLFDDGTFDYYPNNAAVQNDNFTYRFSTGQVVSNAATINIGNVTAAEIAPTAFYSDGAKLYIQYAVLGEDADLHPFSIGLYTSADGITPDQFLNQSIRVENPHQGVYTLPIIPTFTDPQTDYYLIAKVDSGGVENTGEIDEANEANNVIRLSPGSFVVHEAETGQAILHVEGTDFGDPVYVGKDQQSHWNVWANQWAIPSPATGPAYDITGDGIITAMDAVACDAALTGQSGWGWQNATDRFDVDGDGVRSPLDALILINYYNTWSETQFGGPRGSAPMVDVSGDFFFSVLDINQELDKLNNGPGDYNPTARNAANGYTVTSLDIANLFNHPTTIDYGAITVDSVHIRTHGGDDVVQMDYAQAAPLWFFGGDGNDSGTGSADDDFLDGGDGDDILTGLGGDDRIFGGPGNDGLDGDFGGFGDSFPWMQPGNDLLDGGAGNDGIYAEAGNDLLIGGPGSDYLDAGTGDDTLYGDSASIDAFDSFITTLDPFGDSLPALPLDASLSDDDSATAPETAQDDQDFLQGGPGNDTLYGQGGTDTLDGGWDLSNLSYVGYYTEDGDDTLFGGSGNDTLSGGTGDDKELGGLGNDTIDGDTGDDLLLGGAGNDALHGGAGDDRLYGNIGTDVLDDNIGANVLDQDSIPAVSLSGTGTATEDSYFDGQFLLTVPSDVPVRITYHTVDDTAISPDNYESQADTVEIEPGDTSASFFISTGELTDDQLAAGGAAFHVHIDSVTGAPLSGSSDQSVTIVDTLDFTDRSVAVNLNWSRIGDVDLDNSPNNGLCVVPSDSGGCISDERYVQVTLTGPDGLSMSEIRTRAAQFGQNTGTDGVSFPLLDPNTQYTVSITTSKLDVVPQADPETGEPMAPAGLTFTFNSSAVTNNDSQTYAVYYDVLSQNSVCNSGPNYSVPESCFPDNPQAPFVEAFDVFGANNQPYVVLSGGTLSVPWDEGVLCPDVLNYPSPGPLNCGKYQPPPYEPGDPEYNPDEPDNAPPPTQVLTAQLASQPPSGQGTVDLNPATGAFIFHAAAGFFGETFFRIKVLAGGFASLLATINVFADTIEIQQGFANSEGGITGYLPVSGVTRTMWVGEQVILKATAKGRVDMPVTDVKWNIPTKAISNWVSTPAAGYVVPLTDADLSRNTISFYWLDEGEKEVSVSGKVGGAAGGGIPATFNIKRPKNVGLTANTVPGGVDIYPCGGGKCLGLGTIVGNPPPEGIVFNRNGLSLDVPIESRNNFDWTQVVDSTEIVRTLDNSQERRGWGEHLLDDANVIYDPNPSETADSPEVGLTPGSGTDPQQPDYPFHVVFFSDYFSMYLMWKSNRVTQSIRVPIRVVHWYAFGQAHLVGVNNWQVDFAGYSKNPQSQDTTDPPTWVGRTPNDVRWVVGD